MRAGKKAIVALVILLFLPSLLFGVDYAFRGIPARTVRIIDDVSYGGARVTVVASYPSYAISGGTIPLNVTLLTSIPGSNATVHVSAVYAEEVAPVSVNETSTQVEGWRVVSIARLPLNLNFTTTSTGSWVIFLPVLTPPASLSDMFYPTSGVAFNGMANVTLYTGTPSATSSKQFLISPLDKGPFYSSRLLQLRLSSSWLVIQSLTAAAVLPSMILLRGRASSSSSHSAYSRSLEAYRARKALEALDRLWAGDKVPEVAYRQLKSKYEKLAETSNQSG